MRELKILLNRISTYIVSLGLIFFTTPASYVTAQEDNLTTLAPAPDHSSDAEIIIILALIFFVGLFLFLLHLKRKNRSDRMDEGSF